MGYDWKITAKKFLKTSIYIGIAGILTIYSNNPYVMALAPMLHALENYVRHRND